MTKKSGKGQNYVSVIRDDHREAWTFGQCHDDKVTQF